VSRIKMLDIDGMDNRRVIGSQRRRPENRKRVGGRDDGERGWYIEASRRWSVEVEERIPRTELDAGAFWLVRGRVFRKRRKRVPGSIETF
jgi:hypothetical protein